MRCSLQGMLSATARWSRSLAQKKPLKGNPGKESARQVRGVTLRLAMAVIQAAFANGLFEQHRWAMRQHHGVDCP